ncbi:uncharacterized protein BJ171DRAFT_477807 [Polychytrium aggregatum]|uniref:uncharacterized protein n=1 Tax=Polychytrium aggregatum TaxID=110093 RepID=UPI0022FF057C|nr:uncharacterized protein BJ171DRAFT_477807 [Polychytrium aggregatum]KAI9197445.1 hypothetical protein BJ171DRAFT_477807 [Polychytrium aggregatum]
MGGGASKVAHHRAGPSAVHPMPSELPPRSTSPELQERHDSLESAAEPIEAAVADTSEAVAMRNTICELRDTTSKLITALIIVGQERADSGTACKASLQQTHDLNNDEPAEQPNLRVVDESLRCDADAQTDASWMSLVNQASAFPLERPLSRDRPCRLFIIKAKDELSQTQVRLAEALELASQREQELKEMQEKTEVKTATEISANSKDPEAHDTTPPATPSNNLSTDDGRESVLARERPPLFHGHGALTPTQRLHQALPPLMATSIASPGMLPFTRFVVPQTSTASSSGSSGSGSNSVLLAQSLEEEIKRLRKEVTEQGERYEKRIAKLKNRSARHKAEAAVKLYEAKEESKDGVREIHWDAGRRDTSHSVDWVSSLN